MRIVRILIMAQLLFPGFALAGTLTGKVVDARGNPLGSIGFLIVAVKEGTEFKLSTDARGLFAVDLPGGEFVIFSPRFGPSRPVILLDLGTKEHRHLTFEERANVLALVEESSGRIDASSAVGEEDPTLAPIRDYRLRDLRISSVPAQEKRSLAEVVNPFPAQKKGRIHGSLYEFHRNDNFDARNFFDPLGKPLPEYKRNQFGFNVGANLGRSTSLLVTYDGLRISQGATILSHLPTAEMKRGNFEDLPIMLKDPSTGSTLPGNRIPRLRLHPVASRLLALLPDPNRSDPDRNYVNNQAVVRNRDSYSFRIDHQVKSGSNLLISYYLSNSNGFYVHPLPSFGSVDEDHSHEAALSHSQRLKNRLIASWRIDFSRSTDFLGSVNAGRRGLLESLGIRGLGIPNPDEEGYPDFRVAGYTSFGDAGLPVSSVSNRGSLEGSLTFTPEDHNIRMGAGWTSYQANDNRTEGVRRGRFTFNGYYTGDAFADFMLGIPDGASRGIGSDRSDLRRKTWYLYARDEWKISPRFAVSLGLTYSSSPPFRSIHNNISGFYPLLFEPPPDGEIIIAGSDRAKELGLGPAGRGGMVLPDRTDYGPSFGLAYRPMGSNRLVFRSSYSVSYAPLGRDYFVSYLGRNYPFYYMQSAVASMDTPLLDLSSPFDTAVAAELGVRGIESGIRTAYVQNWSVFMQHEAFKNWLLETSYTGNKGTRMPRIIFGNVPLPAAGPIQARRPNPAFGRFSILSGGGAYSRNAMNVAAERRLSNGISLKAGYSWTSWISDLYRGNPGNPRNLRAERAASDFTPSRHLYLNYILDLPFGRNGRFGRSAPPWADILIGGWRFTGITHFQDGVRYTVTLSGDPNNDGVSDDRPDRLGSGKVDSSSRTIDNWFATSDFFPPAPHSYGNSGRNILTGPRYVNWDLSVIKQMRLAGRNIIEFRIEMFNAFNQVNFELPNAGFGTSLFGKIFGAKRAREIEVALRYSF